ncbi:ABC transporter permease [Streptomyces sp. NPDC048248]|uniref:ABC transporter permease n=1 Tax=Streptomyces sp. NPDC048248 TaxID=3365523 RepID=UPI00371A7643
MTSPQQPQPQQPQPERGPDDTAQAQQMPPAPPMPPTAPPQPQGTPPQPGGQGQPEQPAPAREAGTMMLQAQQAPEQQPGQESGTMMLQAQPMPQAQPQPSADAPQPLAAHGPGKDAGTMMLQAQQAPQQQNAYAGAPNPQAPQVPQQGQPQQGHPQQQTGVNWQGGHAGYVSPIPIRRTHLGHALASEWTKIRSVRSTLWTLGVFVLLVIGVDLLITLALSDPTRMVDPKLGFSFLGVLLGTLCLIPLGVLVISSEYGTGMIRTTMTACPSRARVLTAKAIVFFGLAFVITTVTTTLVALFTSGMLYGPDPTTDQWLRGTVGAGLYVSMLGLLALAVGSLLRHSAGAISAMLGVVLLPMLLAVFMAGSESLRKVSEALINYSVPNSLATLYDNPFFDSGPEGWTPLWVLTGVTAVVLGGAFAAQQRRDV